jgi:hypothetical protein
MLRIAAFLRMFQSDISYISPGTGEVIATFRYREYGIFSAAMG